MSKFNQNAPRTIHTAKQIVDSLVNGQRELVSFSELYRGNSLARDVLDELISRVRPLTLKVGQLECKLTNLQNEHDVYEMKQKLRDADKLAAAVDIAVRMGQINSRSRVADARLDYGEAFTTDEAKRIVYGDEKARLVT